MQTLSDHPPRREARLTLADNLPAGTLANCADAVELLAAVDAGRLTEYGTTGMQRLLCEIACTLRGIEELEVLVARRDR